MYPSRVLLAMLVYGCASVSGIAHAQSKQRSYERSVFSAWQSFPANENAAAKSSLAVQAQFPGWTVTTDKISGMPIDIYGVPETEVGSTTVEKSVSVLAGQLSALGFNEAEWIKTSAVSAPKADYVSYVQHISGRPVVFSSLRFRFTKAGMLARVQIKAYGEPESGLQPVITASAALPAAAQGLDGVTITSSVADHDWSWFPVPAASGYTLRPAWHFKITGKQPGGLPLQLTGYVDAISGDILYRSNQIKETGYDLTVKGVVYKNGTLNPATSEPLTDLAMEIGGSTYYTDTAGDYSSSAITLPVTATIPLAGRWSTVYDSVSGTLPVFTDAVLAAGTTFTYPPTTPASDRHINAYYHVSRVHDFMKRFFPTFTGMDFSLPTNVDMTSSTCNAFYDPANVNINFYAADATCHSFAELGDVIYHEYGHGITDHFYTMVTGATITNGALNEATSDIWALSITHSPILAANAFVGYGGFIRRYDMTPQVYPIDLTTSPFLGDPHKNGQIIAGTWWDLGINLGSVDSMTRLFTDVYYDAPDGPDGTEGAVYQSMLIDVLMADDNNSDLSDGTPHYAQIVAAFAKHGIYLEGDALLTHTELPMQPDATPITVSASLHSSTPSYFHDLTMYYRINGGAYTAVTLAGSGSAYTGTIPAQPKGTVVEYYFAIHDALNILNAYFPITCSPALAANQATLPYQFAVGVRAIDSNNFEGPVSGWGIGANPGDDATAGRWQQGVPIANPYFPSWPGGDHTSGSGQCLVTGSGTAGSGFFGESVSMGTTTVLTPVFDISTFTTPIVCYYRWYSNEQNYENFKNDPWIVKIRGVAGSAWQVVESTYQGDDNWRRKIFPVSQYISGAPPQVQLQFFASDSVLSTWADGGQGTTVGGVDDFTIYDKDHYSAVPQLPQAIASVYPNPADDKVQITLKNAGSGAISLYDMNGRKLTGMDILQGTAAYAIDTRSLAPGSYSLVIQTDGLIQSKKVTVAHK